MIRTPSTSTFFAFIKADEGKDAVPPLPGGTPPRRPALPQLQRLQQVIPMRGRWRSPDSIAMRRDHPSARVSDTPRMRSDTPFATLS